MHARGAAFPYGPFSRPAGSDAKLVRGVYVAGRELRGRGPPLYAAVARSGGETVRVEAPGQSCSMAGP
ncbi:hypothetical protein BURKHO8Y_110005 [Burkholderia sp. 8Y]|nr:hypothetical protein BURKHO8Y_110005 [Burkholderia sp. 8Y]